MKPSTLVALRRKIGPWCTHSHPEPDEREAILADLRRADDEFVRAWSATLLEALQEEKKAGPPEPALANASAPHDASNRTLP
jgi:hypothetical protein